MISSSTQKHHPPAGLVSSSSIFEDVPIPVEPDNTKQHQELDNDDDDNDDDNDDNDDDDDSFYLHQDPSTTSSHSTVATELSSSPTHSSTTTRLLPDDRAHLPEGTDGIITSTTTSNSSSRTIPVVNTVESSAADVLQTTNSTAARFLGLPAAAAATMMAPTAPGLRNPVLEATLSMLHLLPRSPSSPHHQAVPLSSETGTAALLTNAPSPPSLLTNIAEPDHPSSTNSNLGINLHHNFHPLNNNSSNPQPNYLSLSSILNTQQQHLPPPHPKKPQEPPYYDQSRLNDPVPDSRRNRGGVTEPFPEKLHTMLNYAITANLTDIISFFPHGRAFGIHKPQRFSEEIMPRFFRQTRLTSFQRQLNLYGFRRIGQGLDNGGYYHELFLRGRPGLCVNMKRTKVKGLGGKIRRNLDMEPNFYAMPPIREAAAAVVVDSSGGNDAVLAAGMISAEESNFADFKLMLQNHHSNHNHNHNDVAHIVLGTPPPAVATPTSSPCHNVLHTSQNSAMPFSIPRIPQQYQQHPTMQSNSFVYPSPLKGSAMVAPYTAAQVRFAQPLSLEPPSSYYYNRPGPNIWPPPSQEFTPPTSMHLAPSQVVATNGSIMAPSSSSVVNHTHLSNLIHPTMMNDTTNVLGNTIPNFRQRQQNVLNMVSPEQVGTHHNMPPLKYNTASSRNSLLSTARQLHTAMDRDGGVLAPGMI